MNKRKHSILNWVELLALVPSILSLGFMALTVGIGIIPAMLGGFLKHFEELGWGLGLAYLITLPVFLIIFLAPGVGIILLWIIIWKGPRCFAENGRLFWFTFLCGLCSVAVATWLIIGILTQGNFAAKPGAIILIWIPLGIGIKYLIALFQERRALRVEA